MAENLTSSDSISLVLFSCFPEKNGIFLFELPQAHLFGILYADVLCVSGHLVQLTVKAVWGLVYQHPGSLFQLLSKPKDFKEKSNDNNFTFSVSL